MGSAADPDVVGRRSERCAVTQPNGTRVQTAAGHPVERRPSAQNLAQHRRRHRLRRFEVGRSAAPGADQRAAVRRHAGAAESGSDPRARRAAGIVCLRQRPPAAISGLRQHPDVGLHRVLELPRAPDVGHAAVRFGLEFLELLCLEQSSGHQQ